MRRLAPVRSSLWIALTLTTVGTLATASRAGNQTTESWSSVAPTPQSLPSSTAEQRGLSQHLKSIGALFYGAHWCPACARQKALFGKQALQTLPYVECDQVPQDRERCQAAGIKAFPTWVLNGKERLEGVQSLDELKIWSGYSR